MSLTGLRRAVARNLPWLRPVLGPVYRAYTSLASRLIGLGDEAFKRRTGARYLPPAPMRYRVGSTAAPERFVESGALMVRDMQAALGMVDRQLADFTRMLDFGCGCGRTLIALQGVPGRPELVGTDIDARAVAWCREHLDFATVIANDPLPPLPFDAEAFDLVLASSVFTHLDEDYQLRWLEELRRVTRPGAILLLSVHGVHCQGELLPGQEQREVAERGFLYRVDHGARGLFPEFYQLAFHAREYVEREWERYFRVRAYLPQGLLNYQDLVVVERE